MKRKIKGNKSNQYRYLSVNVNELGPVGAMSEYARYWDNHHWPCQQPPWGTLNAVDVDTGEIVWKVPLGIVDGLEVKTGTPNLGGSIVAGGVVFIGDHDR